MKKKFLLTLALIVGLLFTTESRAQLIPSYAGDAYSTGNGCYVITPNLQQQAGAAWYDNPIDLNEDFDIVYNGFFGSNNGGADGMTFVLKTSPDAVIGLPGGGLGYQNLPGTNSLAVEFDTYQNSGGTVNDPYYDHIALQKNGNTNHISPNSLTNYVQASATSTNIEDNTDHEIKIKWRADEQRLIVIFDCQERINYNADIINTVFGGESIVYFGFTASTGDLTNQQSVCFEYLSFLESPLEDKTICSGEAVTDINGTLPGASNYQWSPATGVSNTSIPNPVFTPTTTTTYTLTTTDNCGEPTEESFTINVIPAPEVSVTAATSPICSGEDAVFNLNGTPDSEVTYSINNGNQEVITLDATGTATVTVVASTNTQETLQLINIAFENAPFCEAVVTGSASVDIEVIDTSFFMTPDCEGATATVTGDTGGSFAFNPLPTDGASIDSSTGTVSNATPGETYFIEYSVTGACTATGIEQVTVYPAINYTTPSTLTVCDTDENDGFAEFNLTIAVNGISGGNTNLAITFYENETEAESGNATDQLLLNYTNTSALNQTIWVRIEDINTGCYTIITQDLQVNPTPAISSLTDITSCDVDDDGIIDFDLTSALNEVLAIYPNTTVTFYENETQAESGNPADQLATLYSTTSEEEELWVRIENTTGCYSTVALRLIPELLPVLNDVDDIEVCDDNNDGIATFDLTIVENQITANNPDIVITYAYESNGVITEIATPAAFENTINDMQTIWAIAENSSGCSTSLSFNIVVNNCFIQRGISPNSDGQNDSFDLTGLNVSELEIFNRYGLKVYSSSNYTNQWHGQSNEGDELPTGTYFYSMSYANNNQTAKEQKTGWIYINREVN